MSLLRLLYFLFYQTVFLQQFFSLLVAKTLIFQVLSQIINFIVIYSFLVERGDNLIQLGFLRLYLRILIEMVHEGPVKIIKLVFVFLYVRDAASGL